MIKKNKISGYLICLLIMLLISVFLFGSSQYTIYVFKAMTDEFMPAISMTDNDSLLCEFIPMCGISMLEGKDESLFYDYEADMELAMLTENSDSMEAETDENEDASAVSEDMAEANSTDGETSDAREKIQSESESADGGNDEQKSPEDNECEEAAEATEEVVATATAGDLVAASTGAGKNGIVYDMSNLLSFDFLMNNLYNVAGSTSIYPEELNASELLSMDMTLDLSGDEYKILIYHTHGSEAFADSRDGVLEDTVVGLGDELTKILEEEYGVSVYHDRTVYDMMSGTLDRSGAYDYAAEGIDRILAENPSIEVILDIHRDGVDQEVHLVEVIDGKPTAQVMLLNGMSRLNSTGDIDYLYNPYKQENLSFSLKLHLAGKELYGDFMRRIFISGYCYNLNRMPRAALVEVGAQTNTLEEAMNAMKPLAATLYTVLTDK